MRIEIDKEEYKDLIETKEEFVKTVRKLENIIIENIKYRQALDEIEYQVRELFLGVENKDRPYCGNILDIINKTKGA